MSKYKHCNSFLTTARLILANVVIFFLSLHHNVNVSWCLKKELSILIMMVFFITTRVFTVYIARVCVFNGQSLIYASGCRSWYSKDYFIWLQYLMCLRTESSTATVTCMWAILEEQLPPDILPPYATTQGESSEREEQMYIWFPSKCFTHILWKSIRKFITSEQLRGERLPAIMWIFYNTSTPPVPGMRLPDSSTVFLS